MNLPRHIAARAVPHGSSALLRTVEFPLRLVSEANQREHWGARKRRKDNQQITTRLELLRRMPTRKHRDALLPLNVKFTRVGGRRMDKDNNVGSFKHVQDAVAKFFGVADGDASAKWDYDQAPAKRGQPRSVRIEFFAAEGGSK